MELRTNLFETLTQAAASGTADDAQLIARCLDGDERAWRGLVTKYKRLVFSIPLKAGLPLSEAVDIFQQVWAEVLEDLARLQDVTRLKKWLIVLTIEKCSRKGSLNIGKPGKGLSTEISEKSEMNSDLLCLYGQLEIEQAVREAMDVLPPHCAALINHLFFEEHHLPYWRMAEKIGISESSTGSLLEQTLRRLRAVLDDLDIAR
ncbi:MAG: sigma-70 family RNA polymerase sigma factor [Acidobacteriia bacterium]|nr:sigma-70 family RNA polymerase sigma factor [Terriglobia bacterium]